MIFPDAFTQQMKEYFRRYPEMDEEAFFEALKKPYHRGLRFNRLKVDPSNDKNLLHLLNELPKRVPWSTSGYYSSDHVSGNHPLFHAGAYYIQEPSAMLPAEMLDIEPDDNVLDLCAAPGGKATRIAEKLDGKGVLIANEISRSRASALLYHIERMGIRNVLIFNETPEKLATVFGSYFDKILIDAPCSGEGMFRRDSVAMSSWTKYAPESISKIQKEIMSYADKLLKPGGHIVYSTCTFSEKENEDVISNFILSHHGYKIINHTEYQDMLTPGEILGQKGAVRIWPHRHDGEGHFCVHLKKSEESECVSSSLEEFFLPINRPDKEQHRSIMEFFEMIFDSEYYFDVLQGNDKLHIKNGHIRIMTDKFLTFHNVKCIKDGFYLGEIKYAGKKSRFIPSHALALSSSLCQINARHRIQLSYLDQRVMKYLRGETLQLTNKEISQLAHKGFVIIVMDEFPIGWGKIENNTIKNLYPKAWRIK